MSFRTNCLADIFIWSQSVFVKRKWKTSLVAGSWGQQQPKPDSKQKLACYIFCPAMTYNIDVYEIEK